MQVLVSLLALAVFGYFVYRALKKGRALLSSSPSEVEPKPRDDKGSPGNPVP